MFLIQVIRFEGVGENIDQFVYTQGKLAEKVGENGVLGIFPGVLKILVKSKSGKVPICTGNYQTSSLPKVGFQWLPLSKNSQNMFFSLPLEVKEPRVLVQVTNDTLSPVVEQVESEENENFAEKIGTNHLECRKEVEEFKIKYEKVLRDNEELREEIKLMRARQEDIKNNAKMREEFLEQLINYRENKNCPENTVNNQEIYEKKDFLTCENREFKENLPSRENSAYKPKKVVGEILNSCKKEKIIHDAVQDFMKTSTGNLKFIKESGGFYWFGNKKVFITLKNGHLLCRVGGGFERIDKFVKKTEETLQKSYRRLSTEGSMPCKSSRTPLKLLKPRKSPSSSTRKTNLTL